VTPVGAGERALEVLDFYQGLQPSDEIALIYPRIETSAQL
jgi:hypothetical protein